MSDRSAYSTVTIPFPVRGSTENRSSGSTTGSNRQSEVISESRCSPSAMFAAAVDTEFYESETLFLAALETLWIAYMQPLINAQCSGRRPSTAAHLDTTFGADVQSMIACHTAILKAFHESLEQQMPPASSSRGSSTLAPPDEDSSCTSPVITRTEEEELDGGHVTEAAYSDPLSPPLSGGFPEILLRMTPTMADVYGRYVKNYTSNLAAAEAVRRDIPNQLWETSYASLARLTLPERVRPWLDHHHTLRSSTTSIDNLLLTFSTEFAALVTLPVQRIARYTLMIKEWVKSRSDEPCASADHSSPFRRCRMEANQNAVDAAEKLHAICSTIEHIRSAMESTTHLMKLERQLGVPNAGLSQHEGMVLVHDSTLVKAKPKGKGTWHMKPSHGVLLDRVLLLVECCDDARTKCKRVFSIPMQAIQDVRRLCSVPAISKELPGHVGFVVRFVLTQNVTSSATSFFGRKSVAPQTTVEELILLDDDEANIDIWMADLSLQVARSLDAS